VGLLLLALLLTPLVFLSRANAAPPMEMALAPELVSMDSSALAVPQPILLVDKVVDKDEATPWETLRYTVTVVNNAGSVPLNMQILDELPPEMELITDTLWASSGEPGISDGSIVWTGDVQPREPLQISYELHMVRVVCDVVIHNRARVNVVGAVSLASPDVAVRILCPDLGDAPASANHYGVPMSAYPPAPVAVVARYPTVFGLPAGTPRGPMHRFPKRDAWLGYNVSWELDADLLPDQDGLTNIYPPGNAPNRDRWDDGVVNTSIRPDCVPTTFNYRVRVVGPRRTRYVNVWFDWNRDGDWEDTFDCPDGTLAPEWAVQNQPITLGPGYYVLTTTAFFPYNPNPYLPTWMRITLAEREAPPNPLTGYADGRGPDFGYRFGETEDYYVRGLQSPVVVTKTWVNPRHTPATDVAAGRPFAVPSDTLRFDIVVHNTGATTVTNVGLWDGFRSSCITLEDWTIRPTQVMTDSVVWDPLANELGPGEKINLTLWFHAEDIPGGELENHCVNAVVVRALDEQQRPIQDEDQVDVWVFKPHVQVEKWWIDPSGAVSANPVAVVSDTMTYMIHITNDGPALIQPQVKDDYPACVTFLSSQPPPSSHDPIARELRWENVLPWLLPGHSFDIQVDFHADEPCQDWNLVDVTTEPPGGYDSGQAPVYIVPPGDITVTKRWVNPEDFGGHPGTVPSSTVEFEIIVTNTGGAPLYRVDLWDLYDPDCITLLRPSMPPTEDTPGAIYWQHLADELGPGESVSVMLTFHAEEPPPGKLVMHCVNTARVTAMDPRSLLPVLLTAEDEEDVWIFRPALRIAKDWTNRPPDGIAPISSTLEFVITVTNPGYVPLTPIVVDQYPTQCLTFQDATPPPTFQTSGYLRWASLPTLFHDDVVTIGLSFHADQECHFYNLAEVHAREYPHVFARDVARFDIGQPPDMVVTKRWTNPRWFNNERYAAPGDTVEFQVGVTNTSSGPLTHVTLWDLFQPWCLQAQGWTISPTTVLTDSLFWEPLTDTLQPGEGISLTLWFQAQEPPFSNEDARCRNYVVAGATNGIGELVHASDAEWVRIISPRVRVNKRWVVPAEAPSNAPVAAISDTIIFAIDVTNPGPIPMTPLAHDIYPTQCLEFLSSDPPPTNHDPVAGILYWEPVTDTLLPGETVTILVDFHAKDECRAENIAVALTDPPGGRARDRVPFWIGGADLWISKTLVHVPWVDVEPRQVAGVAPAQATPMHHPGWRWAFLIRYGNQGTAPAHDVTITDILPADAIYVSSHSLPDIEPPTWVTPTLTWNAGTLMPGQGGWIVLRARLPYTLPGGTPVTNTALITSTTVDVDPSNNESSISGEVPLRPPRITWPIPGTDCTGTLTITGQAQISTVVSIYIDDVLTAAVQTNEDGIWSYAVPEPLSDGDHGIYAVASTTYSSSNPSPIVTVTVDSTLNWDPKLTLFGAQLQNGVWVWQHIRTEEGRADPEGWRIRMLPNITMTAAVYVCCSDPASTLVTLTVEGVDYPLPNYTGMTWYGVGGWFTGTFQTPITFTPGVPISMYITVNCGGDMQTGGGGGLIDPTGVVFNVDVGRDNGLLNGVEVTLWEQDEGGGYQRWPAELYDEQQNPQSTGSDGRYSFMVPPGTYRVSTDYTGYQPYESWDLVVTFVTVELDIPLTPVYGDADYSVSVDSSGFAPAFLTVPVGSVVEWVNTETAEGNEHTTTSNLDAREYTAGWDSGLLDMGDSYRRRLNQVGTFPYADHEDSNLVGTIKVCQTEDLDCSDAVDVIDLQLVAGRWNLAAGQPGYVARYDLDHSGDISIVDVQQVAAAWGWSLMPKRSSSSGLSTKAAMGAAQLTIEPLEGKPGGAQRFALRISNAQEVGAVEVTFKYNPIQFRLGDIEFGDWLGSSGRPAGWLGPKVDAQAGLVTFAGYTLGTGAGASGDGVLATFTLEPAAPGRSLLRLWSGAVAGVMGERLPVSANSSVSVRSGQLTHLPFVVGQ